MKILLVEDELELQNIITKYLEKENYLIETANNFNQALDKIIDFHYDCILLDVMLPDGNGIDLIDEIKKQDKTHSIIVISAKDSIEDKILGLELGADDYLTKPFHLAELNARIKSVLRRNNHQNSNSIVWNNLEISPENRTVSIQGNSLNLNKKEFDLLYYFITNPKKLITKTAIAEYVWGDYVYDQVESLDFVYSQVKNLRKKLKDAKAEILIQSVYGIGYKMMNNS